MATYKCTGCGFETRDNNFLKDHICVYYNPNPNFGKPDIQITTAKEV
jgi:hypothetical protein